MRWFDVDFPSPVTERPVVTVSLMSLERAVIDLFLRRELHDYESGKLPPTVWREDLLRGLLVKVNG